MQCPFCDSPNLSLAEGEGQEPSALADFSTLMCNNCGINVLDFPLPRLEAPN